MVSHYNISLLFINDLMLCTNLCRLESLLKMDIRHESSIFIISLYFFTTAVSFHAFLLIAPKFSLFLVFYSVLFTPTIKN
jgi:hypothetical protein